MTSPAAAADPVDPTDPAAVEAAAAAAVAAIASASDLTELARVHRDHAGDKSPLALANRVIGGLQPADKAAAGRAVGTARAQVSAALADRESVLKAERDAAVLFVTHDINPILGRVDRILYIAGGRFVLGTPDEVLQSRVLTDLYGTPVFVLRAGDRLVVVGVPDAEPHHHDADPDAEPVEAPPAEGGFA